MGKKIKKNFLRRIIHQQEKAVQSISDAELLQSLIYTQILFMILAFFLSIFLFSSDTSWGMLFIFNGAEIIYYGLLPGLIIVCLDLILMIVFPKEYYDDGGVNERIFTNRSIPQILFLTLLIAVSEELLFRGVIQTVFGFVFASIVFSLMHVRYLLKPLLMILLVFISLTIGYLYEVTSNLLVTITLHFTVDFLLGMIIYLKNRGGS